MGFGLLFVGYFTATIMSLNVCGGAFALIGYLLMLFGAKKIMQYNRTFLFLLIASSVMVLFSSALAVYDISSLLYKYLIIPLVPISDSVYDILMNVRLVLDLVFTAILCYCIKNIAKETGVEKIHYAAVRNFVFYCIFFLLQSLVWLSTVIVSPGYQEFVFSMLLPVWVVIIKLVCLIFICIMLFSCYSKICDVNDVDMPQKPSKFAFVNKRREESERRRKEYLEEAKKREEAKKSQPSGKNKK